MGWNGNPLPGILEIIQLVIQVFSSMVFEDVLVLLLYFLLISEEFTSSGLAILFLLGISSPEMLVKVLVYLLALALNPWTISVYSSLLKYSSRSSTQI